MYRITRQKSHIATLHALDTWLDLVAQHLQATEFTSPTLWKQHTGYQDTRYGAEREVVEAALSWRSSQGGRAVLVQADNLYCSSPGGGGAPATKLRRTATEHKLPSVGVDEGEGSADMVTAPAPAQHMWAVTRSTTSRWHR
jgi:hypothetical protein